MAAGTQATTSAHADLVALATALHPGARSVRVEPLRPDAGPAGETAKAIGYGAPLRLRVIDAAGAAHELVFHTATSNDFGHDRRADRAEEALLAWDTFPTIPRHVQAIDVGAIRADGRLVSLGDAGELYLITEFARGRVYADDLRRVADTGVATADDLARVELLARYLVELHAERRDHPGAWRRAVRDLVGHGECIFGVVDNYAPDVPAAPPSRLREIEARCLGWRWRLKDRPHRLRRTHGDFHPFNIVFDERGELHLLDASRGSQGDPADDLAALAINFPFFALERPASWRRGLGALWHRFFTTWLDGSGDREVLETLPPFLAFRGLVVANPLFYPALAAPDRDRLLGYVERTLASERFDPATADALFADAP